MFYSPHPLLRKRETETATVSFELLFDLIYVFSVTQLSHYLLHNLTWEGLLKETILWFAVWMLWQHTIWVTNWFNPDTRPIPYSSFYQYAGGAGDVAAYSLCLYLPGIDICCLLCSDTGRENTLYYRGVRRSSSGC